MSKPSRSHHRELIELAALFAAAGVADVFTNALGHRIDGPSILIALGVVVAVVTLAQYLHGKRALRTSASPTRVGRMPALDHAADCSGPAGELWRVRTMVQDTPGRLAVLAGAFAAVGANILALQVQPVAGAVVDEFLVEAAADVTPQRLAAAVAAAGGGEVHVVAADVSALADLPARALTLAHRLAQAPDELGRVLAELLGQAQVEWQPGGDPATCGVDAAEGTVMRVRDPRRGVTVVSRPEIPFTLVEFARAQAMADLAGVLHAAEA